MHDGLPQGLCDFCLADVVGGECDLVCGLFVCCWVLLLGCGSHVECAAFYFLHVEFDAVDGEGEGVGVGLRWEVEGGDEEGEEDGGLFHWFRVVFII